MQADRRLQPDLYEFVPAPEGLQAYIEYVAYTIASGPIAGVELMLTRAGVKFARADHTRGSHELARWLMQQPLWRGERSQKNVAAEISAHAIFAHWPFISKRANPVNIEYFQNWPLSLFLQSRDRLLAALRLRPRHDVT